MCHLLNMTHLDKHNNTVLRWNQHNMIHSFILEHNKKEHMEAKSSSYPEGLKKYLCVQSLHTFIAESDFSCNSYWLATVKQI